MKKDLAKPKSKRDLSDIAVQMFVKEGSGRDTELKKKGFKGLSPDIPMSRLTIDLPEELHQEFKIACVKSRKKMNEEIRNMVVRYLEEM